jgi:hypothetical protein
MHHHYADITDKLGEPRWWDEHAVPRYCEFGPREAADIYAREVALVEIACQDCARRFLVCFSAGPSAAVYGGRSSLKEQIDDNTLHYGDPPNYGCCPAGPTMNSYPVRVVEFWEAIPAYAPFRRAPEYERAIEPDWQPAWKAG